MPTLMHASETWVWQKRHNKNRLTAVKMVHPRKVTGKTRKGKARNERVLNECGVKESVVSRVGKGILHWFSRVEQMNSEQLTMGVYNGNVVDGRNDSG